MGRRRAAAVVLAFLLVSLVVSAGGRGDDWIPRTLDPVLRELRGGARDRRPARAARPKNRQQDERPSAVPTSPGETAAEPTGEPGAPSNPEPSQPTETAQPTPPQTTLAREAEARSEAEPRQHPLARKLTGLAAVALALAAVPLAIRLRRRGDLAAVIDYPPDQRGNLRAEPSERRAAAPNPTATVPALAASPATGRYEILEEVGHGGMAVVYRARDTRLDRIVALKRISDNLREHPRAVDLLLREARSAARLNHPHIVTVYDVDQEAGSYFITMEFLEGKPLLGLLQRRGRFAPKPVVWLGQQVAAGLAYAHERGIVHRDIKTANLFFVLRIQTLKIMDFGLAKMLEEVRRRATLIGGTPSYMAPEQAQGLAVDGRADLYAFGVTLFELLTGTLPFEDGDLADQHRHAPPPDPRGRAQGIPDALAKLVLHLLAKRPEDRPASAGEVAAKLREIEGTLG